MILRTSECGGKLSQRLVALADKLRDFLLFDVNADDLRRFGRAATLYRRLTASRLDRICSGAPSH
jgi:hypothetical protein